ncbi:MAG: hypothetical protein LBJ67_06835, partial [Planctomycetaceae bacterium]|jgi:hypothetical protein|nr:hypothetical protein [Planctomycetaceae bacterium]
LLDCWIAGLLDCWIAGLLDCWIAGLLDCWIAGLLDCWIALRILRLCTENSDVRISIHQDIFYALQQKFLEVLSNRRAR